MLSRNGVRLLAIFCSVSILVEARQDPAGCGNGSMVTRREEDRFLYAKAQVDRFAQTGSILSLAPTPEAGAVDVGAIAVVDDSDGVRVRRNPFNLQLKRLTFIRQDNGAYTVTASNADFDIDAAVNGNKLSGLDDDDSREIPLPFEFPFYGGRYRSVFVNSDGNLTFGMGDNASSDRNLSRMAAGPPRICPLFADLDPSNSQQGVRVFSEAGRVVISWANVPFYGLTRMQTFQVALYPSGAVEFTYGDTNVVTDNVVVGISPGQLLGETRLATLNLSNGETYAGTVAEVFAGSESYDISRAIQRFFTTHEDAYDNIFVFNALQMPPSLCPLAIACTDVVRNKVTGHGRLVLDDGAIYGSPKRLETVIDMGPLEGYPNDPYQIHPGRIGTGDTGLNIFGHEASHRFLAWVSPADASGNQFLLGRQGAHWNFNFNSEGSLVEGNRIIDLGPDANPRFFSAGAGERVSPLDQYFFGWRPPEEVPPTFVVLNSSVTNLVAPPAIGARFNGTRREVTVEEMIAAAGGRRVPDHELAPRKYRWAILLITRADQPLPTTMVDKLERYRQALPAFWSKVSEGRSEMELEFRRSLDVSFAPYAELTAGSQIDATVTIRNPASQDLTITLEANGGPSVDAPRSIVIPAGATSVTFPLTAIGPGSQILTLRPSDTSYETVETRLRTLASDAPAAPNTTTLRTRSR